MATHLVTGGAGFIGGELARELVRRGERVRVLDLLDPGLRDGVEVVRGDIRDRRVVEEAVAGVDVVHHNAALVPVAKAGAEFSRVNAGGTAVALEAARSAGVKLFVLVSSSAVYGIPAECPITASTPRRPVEDYGRSKLEAELAVERAAREGLPCAIVRPRTVIGRGRLGIFKILYEWIAEGRRIYVLGSGANRYQFVDVADVVEALCRVAELRRAGVFNVGAERFGTLRDDLTAVIEHARTGARVVGTPVGLARAALRLLDAAGVSPLAPYHLAVYSEDFYFDVSAVIAELGWRPRAG
jgi:nucleoside-diphosphate-sugar epimerase